MIDDFVVKTRSKDYTILLSALNCNQSSKLNVMNVILYNARKIMRWLNLYKWSNQELGLGNKEMAKHLYR